METQTTLKHLPEKIKELDISPEASVRVIIEEIEITEEKPSGEAFLPFLDDDDFWEGEDTPGDLSVNVDHYLYDE